MWGEPESEARVVQRKKNWFVNLFLPSNITELQNVGCQEGKKSFCSYMFGTALSLYRPVIIIPILGDTCNGIIASLFFCIGTCI